MGFDFSSSNSRDSKAVGNIYRIIQITIDHVQTFDYSLHSLGGKTSFKPVNPRLFVPTWLRHPV